MDSDPGEGEKPWNAPFATDQATADFNGLFHTGVAPVSLKIIYNNYRFISLFWTQFLGILSLNVFRNSLVILIAYKGVEIAGVGPDKIVAASGGIFILPYFLFSAVAGQLSDKLEKSSMIRLIKLGEFLIVLVISFGFYSDNYSLLLLALFLMGVQATFFGPLKYGIIPDLVKDSDLVAANGYVVSGTFLAILIGTISGGVVTTLPYLKPVLLTSILVLSAGGVIASWQIPKIPVHAKEVKVQWNLYTPTLDILGEIRKNRPIYNSILGMSWFWFLGAGMVTVLPLYSKDVLHAEKGVVTLLLALFAVGIGTGSVVCEWLSRGRVEIGLIPLGTIGMSLFLADLYWVGASWPAPAPGAGLHHLTDLFSQPGGLRAPIDVFLVALFGGLFIMPLYSFVQQRGESHFIARIMAGNNILNALFGVVGAVAIIGLFYLGVGVKEVIAICAIINVGMAIFIFYRVPEFSTRFVSWFLSRLVYRVKVDGVENIPEEGPLVLLCNRTGSLNWAILSGVVKAPVRYYTEHRMPLGRGSGWLFRRAGELLAPSTGSLPEAGEGASQLTEMLGNGGVAAILPEGALDRLDASDQAGGDSFRFGPMAERIFREQTKTNHPPAALAAVLYAEDGGTPGAFSLASVLSWFFRGRRKFVLKFGPVAESGAMDRDGMNEMVRNALRPHPPVGGGAYELGPVTGEE